MRTISEDFLWGKKDVFFRTGAHTAVCFSSHLLPAQFQVKHPGVTDFRLSGEGREDIKISKDGWLYLETPLDWSTQDHYILTVSQSLHDKSQKHQYRIHNAVLPLSLYVNRWRRWRVTWWWKDQRLSPSTYWTSITTLHSSARVSTQQWLEKTMQQVCVCVCYTGVMDFCLNKNVFS